MTREEIIRNLKHTMKKHENDTVNTFGTNISAMCKDILNYLEQESKTDVLDKMRAEIVDTLYVDSLIFGELIDFKNGKISADDVIEEFNRVTRTEVLKIIDKYKESEVENE